MTYTSGAISETTKFRAVVQSGSCAEAYSTPATITVIPGAVAGTVIGGSTICEGSTSDLLTLSGHSGTIIKWQSAVAPFTSWVDIANTTDTYTSAGLSETTQFRAVVQSGVCSQAVSSPTTVSVDAMPTASFTSVANMLSVVFTNTSTGASSYSWNFGSSGDTSIATSPTYVYPSQGQYTVVLTAINGACTSTASQIINITNIEIQENSNSSVNIYPIPTSGNIKIHFIESIFHSVEIKVFDITGKLVYVNSAVEVSENLDLDLNTLPSGMYRLQIKGDKIIVNKGFVIRR